jgi:hypothetical protein
MLHKSVNDCYQGAGILSRLAGKTGAVGSPNIDQIGKVGRFKSEVILLAAKELQIV